MKKLMLLVLTVAPVAFGGHTTTPGGQAGHSSTRNEAMWNSTKCEGLRDARKGLKDKAIKTAKAEREACSKQAKRDKHWTSQECTTRHKAAVKAYDAFKGNTARIVRVCGREAAAKRGN